MLVSATSRSCPRWPSLSVSCSSPVSASTRYAANSPALRRNSTLDSEHVAPEEAGQVQPHEEYDERVDDLGQAVVREAVAEQRPVGQGVLQVPRHQGRLDLLAVRRLAAADHADRLDGGEPEAAQVAQQAVLPDRPSARGSA